MTLTEKTLAQVKPTTKAAIFTATAKTIIKNIIITNNGVSDAGATIWADSDGTNANDENLINGSYLLPTGITTSRDVFIVLEIGGRITAEGTGASVTISGAEIV